MGRILALDQMPDEFKYIVRIANTDLDGNKSVGYALQKIKGIGDRMAALIADRANIDRTAKVGNLDDEKIEKLKETVSSIEEWTPSWMLNRQKDLMSGKDEHLIGIEIDMRRREDINLLKKIHSYRGIRHGQGLSVRGQRTRGNKRKGLAVGVSKKKVRKEARKEVKTGRYWATQNFLEKNTRVLSIHGKRTE